MELSGSDAGENRLAALETSVGGVGMLVKKFTADLLDLKGDYREMSREHTEHPVLEHGSIECAAPDVTAPQERDCTAVPAGQPRAVEPVPPAPDAPVMVMIMQTDGTMKPEVRRGNKSCLSAPVGYGVSGGSSRKGLPIRPGQSRLT
ncbi:hypothetical protein [Methanoregula sp. UBA64]|uniref:hypothetical protein n=1 Tax=Methanoregula sp. UBA64 TaxID=1915554 RepID=UPI0025E7F76A|nr:hypothetical protein [Methanoregula sp. UBA64]